MPGVDGLAVLKWVSDRQPDVDVVLLTGHGEVKDAVEAMKQGAWDFLIKDTPFDGTAVKTALAKLRTVRALRQENLAARRGGYTHKPPHRKPPCSSREKPAPARKWWRGYFMI
jgi:DNA-binding NtrC family response regulator